MSIDNKDSQVKWFQRALTGFLILVLNLPLVIFLNWDKFKDFGLSELSFVLEIIGFILAYLGLRFPHLLDVLEDEVKAATADKPRIFEGENYLSWDTFFLHLIGAWLLCFAIPVLAQMYEARVMAPNDYDSARDIVESIQHFKIAKDAVALSMVWVVFYYIFRILYSVISLGFGHSARAFTAFSSRIAYDKKIITGSGFLLALTGIVLNAYQLICR